jgi:hypothetical protein
MLTRQEIQTQYDVDPSGVIRTPGKFEGEMLYAPYFYECFLEGFADEDDGCTARFDVTPADVLLFPELADVTSVTLSVDDNGFVFVRAHAGRAPQPLH